MDLIKVNISNLTSLWKTAGHLGGQIIETSTFYISQVAHGDWPNKFWFTKPLELKYLKITYQDCKQNKLSLPIWGKDIAAQTSILESYGFEEKLSQVAMSLNLKGAIFSKGHLLIKKVSNPALAKEWSRCFLEAFGYEISHVIIEQSMTSIDYFIAYDKDRPVGTAVLFIDQFGIAGIHSMGIIPSQRKKGFARQLLNQMLSLAQLNGCRLVTLQASDMGKHLYLKTGFQEDFIIKTFTIKN